jgi:transcriptional regulator with GAF, ATPase, and Fis domain
MTQPWPDPVDTDALRRDARLAQSLVALADTLVDDYDIVDLLDRLVAASVDLLDVDAAGLLLLDQGGRLQLMASSSEEVRLLELLQIQTDEGPCLDCVRTGSPVVADHLTESSPWPTFAKAATAGGYGVVMALPLRLRNETIGGINLFRAEARSIGEDGLRIAQALADIATIGILQQRSIHRTSLLAEQLQSALNTRLTIEQAKGVLAERAHLSMESAYQRIRAYARNNNLKLSAVAHAIASSTLAADEVSRPTATPEERRSLET